MTFLGDYMSVEEVTSIPPDRKTRTWKIKDRDGGTLGYVSWLASWRQYTFQPAASTTFDNGCLGEIGKFLEQANDWHREELKGRKT